MNWQSARRSTAFTALVIACMASGGAQCGAQIAKDFLTAGIDSTVSPRHDFFQYANGSWLQRHPIPADANSWGIANLVSLDIDGRLRQISEAAAARKGPKGSPEQLIGDFWFTGMDSVTINRQALAPLKPDFDRIDRIRSVADLIDVVAIFHSREQFIGGPRSRVLFFGHVEQDETNSDRWIYGFLQSGISMAPPYYAGTDPQQTGC
jgi:putative endopeptidase